MSQPGAAAARSGGEEQLNRAIEELRGVLNADATQPAPAGMNSTVILNIPVEVQIVLGSAEMTVSDLMSLQKGSTVALNRRVGEPVDVMVNGRRIARGEITVMEDDPARFGIRLTEIITSGGQA